MTIVSDIQSTSSTANQAVDPRVAEADDGGAQRDDAELLHHAEVLEPGVPDERAEHGVAVEDGARVLGAGRNQPRPKTTTRRT